MVFSPRIPSRYEYMEKQTVFYSFSQSIAKIILKIKNKEYRKQDTGDLFIYDPFDLAQDRFTNDY